MFIDHPSARKLLLYCYLQNTNLFAFHLELKLINFYSNKTSSTVIIYISLSHFLCNLVNWFSSLKTVKNKKQKKRNIVFIWTLTGLIHSYFVQRLLPWKKKIISCLEKSYITYISFPLHHILEKSTEVCVSLIPNCSLVVGVNGFVCLLLWSQYNEDTVPDHWVVIWKP